MAAYHAGAIPKPKSVAERPRRKIGDWGIEMYEIGTWAAHFKYPIAPFVDDAGQYKVRFIPHGKQRTKLVIDDAWVEIGGVRMPGFVQPSDEEYVYDVYMGGTGQDIVFHATSQLGPHPGLRGEATIERVT